MFIFSVYTFLTIKNVQMISSFRRWMSDSKNDLLLKVGRPIPALSVFTPDKKLSKIFCKLFNPNLYQQYLLVG